MNGGVILLVEDNENDEILTLRALKRSNIINDVVVTRDGVEALEYLHGSAKQPGQPPGPIPRLVLLDLNLPRIDGHEVLRRIRADESTKYLPVVILTSSKEDEDIVRSYSQGANAYVRKPVDFGQFADAVKALGFFWLLLNEPAPVRKGASSA